MVRFSLILVGAVLLASLNHVFNPDRPAWNPEVLGEGEVLLSQLGRQDQILWVDARSVDAFVKEHIAGAINLNEDDWDAQLPELLAVWEPDLKIVVYCSSQTCQASHAVAERLRTEVGLGDVTVLKGGWEAWQAAQK